MASLKVDPRQFADMVTALSADQSDRMLSLIEGRVETATRHLVLFLGEADGCPSWEADFRRELEAVAADPARAFGSHPTTEGARQARKGLALLAYQRRLDTERRSDAASLGDLARTWLRRPASVRVDISLILGEEQLFADIIETVWEAAPDKLERLPSNEEAEWKKHPILDFAETFIQAVVDRFCDRHPNRPAPVQRRLDALLNKSPRRLIDGLRTARRNHRREGAWFEGESKAALLKRPPRN